MIWVYLENVFQQRGGESLASIKDVARQAGVAISTVSKVLNGYEGVSESTKDKVNAAIEALNYTPNAVAAALSSAANAFISGSAASSCAAARSLSARS